MIFYLFFQKNYLFYNKHLIKGSNKLVKIPDPFCYEIDL